MHLSVLGNWQSHTCHLRLLQNVVCCISEETFSFINRIFLSLPHGLVVRIAGSHPAGPGSIPGGGIILLVVK